MKNVYLAVRIVILRKRQIVVFKLDDMFFTRKICWNFVVNKPVLQEKNKEI